MHAAIVATLGHLPFSQIGGALLFDVPAALQKHGSEIVTANPNFEAWPSAYGDAKVTKGFRDD